MTKMKNMIVLLISVTITAAFASCSNPVSPLYSTEALMEEAIVEDNSAAPEAADDGSKDAETSDDDADDDDKSNDSSNKGPGNNNGQGKDQGNHYGWDK
ncbi:MAG: hypothetical protein RQ801_07160 [Spirochaetaceae bacterium]|nr:hypothetical protein [Spirochaetaceae bacterium]MDT8298060.1 hypothetical protein [Spirochaetaceae bacterium]